MGVLPETSILLKIIMKFDDTRDFPYYRNNPRISKKAWIMLLLLVPISFIIYSIFLDASDLFASILFCFILLIPLLYVSNWDYTLIFRKPTRNEIILAVLMFVGYIVYAIVVGEILDYYGLAGTGLTEDTVVTLENIVALVFSLMGEELIKFIPLMFFMRLFYKFTSNRKFSIAASSVIIMIYFGVLHYSPPYSTMISVLLIQGFGTIFELYGYLRTKNLIVSYISHLLTDAIIYILIFLGM